MNRKLPIVVCVLATMCGTLRADEAFDWDAWRGIVVLAGGRTKPLETHAVEFVTAMVGRSSFTPEVFSAISASDVDWVKLAEHFKQAHAGKGGKAAQRVWRLLPADLQTTILTTNLDSDDLVRQTEAAEEKIKAVRAKYLPEDARPLNLIRLRKRIDPADATAVKTVDEYEDLTGKLLAVDTCKAKLIRELNALLPRDDLYEASAWQGVTLPANGSQLLAADQKTPRENSRLNQLLIVAALADAIKLIEPGTTKEGAVALQPRRYGPVELYVTWLLSWQGWDKLEEITKLRDRMQKTQESLRNDEYYWEIGKPDVWDLVPMIESRYEAIGPMLRPELPTAVSVWTVAKNAEFANAAFRYSRLLREEIDLTPAQEKAMSAFDAYRNFTNHRMGFNLELAPHDVKNADPKKESPHRWFSIFALLYGNDELDKSAFAKPEVEELRSAFYQARRGLLANAPADFNAGSRKFAAILAGWKKHSTIYPAPDEIATELHYNRFAPFLKTTILAAAAAMILGISLGVRHQLPYLLGFGTLIAAMLVDAYGIYLRVAISGRAPVTNMYETIIWASWFGTLVAVVLGAVYRQRIIPTAAAIMLTLSTLLAYFMPIDMGASITPLNPVLRTNYWLVVHVLTIVASYGACMLAWALGNIGLTYYLVGADKSESIKPMTNFIYRSMQVGVLLLAAGTGLGGWWAAESWGRFWGWDPKEVWAFISLIGYLAILHGRYAGLIGLFGLTAGSVLAFNLIVMSWYGVNFLLGTGLHAYAFGSGGREYVLSVAAANIAYVFLVMAVYKGRLLRQHLRRPAAGEPTEAPVADALDSSATKPAAAAPPLPGADPKPAAESFD